MFSAAVENFGKDFPKNREPQGGTYGDNPKVAWFKSRPRNQLNSHKHGISFEDVNFEEGTGHHFISDQTDEYFNLLDNDKEIIDCVIDCFGGANRSAIVEIMHKEKAYIETAPNDIIQYKYAKELSI